VDTVDHAPFESQVCTLLPEHCEAPGTQTPLHAPLRHTALPQDCALPQVPVALHVCTPLPRHLVAPGEHSPVQVPETHA
jgi:hypothetical protein